MMTTDEAIEYLAEEMFNVQQHVMPRPRDRWVDQTFNCKRNFRTDARAALLQMGVLELLA